MDDARFDGLARRLLPGFISRRPLVGGAATALLTVLLGQQEAAACVAIGKQCKQANGSTKHCCGGATCSGNRCRCPSGKKNSGGVCAKRPHCQGATATALCTSDAECCSKWCGVAHECVLSDPGQRCQRDADCLGDGPCVGFRCQY